MVRIRQRRASTPKKRSPSDEAKAETSASKLFELLCDQLKDQVDVECGAKRSGFGANALKVNGKIFAMVSSRSQLVFKLPGNRVRELAQQDIGTPFDPGRGRLMREWLVLLKDSRATALALAIEALEFGRRE
jgi:hypothetical protein